MEDKLQLLKKGIEFAKQNPDSPQAIELRKRIESGMYTKEINQIKTGYMPPVEKTTLQKVGTGIKDVAMGVEKGVGSTTLGLGELALKGANLIPGINKVLPINDSIQFAEDLKNKQFTPENTAQSVGNEVEQIAELFIPVGLEAKVARALAKVPELAKDASLLSKIRQGLFKIGAKSTASGTEFASKTLAQTGGDVPASLEAGAIGAAVPIVAPLIKATGKIASEVAIPISMREAGLIQSYKANTTFIERLMNGVAGKEGGPTTAGKTAFKKGLMGSETQIGIQAKKVANNLWTGLIKPALDRSNIKINLNSFFDTAKKQIIKDNPELNRQQSLLEALESLREPYAKMKDVGLNQLQKFKEGWAEFVPEKAYQGKPIAGAYNDVKDTVADIARNTIYDNLGPEIKQAYFDYGNLKGLQELGKKAMTGGKLKGGFGNFWNAVKDIALTPIATVGGQTVYKVGQGIEMFGKQGAKTLSDIILGDSE